MKNIISISNQKGGVGKTTTTQALASALKGRGFKVLAIDMDPQANLTFCLGADNENLPTIYDVLRGDATLEEAVQSTEGGDVVAANILLSGIELEFTQTGREFLLHERLQIITEQYDYVLIDTPPALSILTVNAFTASDYVIVPMLSDIFSLQGIAQLFETVTKVRKYCNPKLKIGGILLTRFNGRTILSNEIKGTAELIAQDLEITLFDTKIRTSIALSEAQSMQKNMLVYNKRANAVQDYQDFVEELITRGILA